MGVGFQARRAEASMSRCQPIYFPNPGGYQWFSSQEPHCPKRVGRAMTCQRQLRRWRIASKTSWSTQSFIKLSLEVQNRKYMQVARVIYIYLFQDNTPRHRGRSWTIALWQLSTAGRSLGKEGLKDRSLFQALDYIYPNEYVAQNGIYTNSSLK